MAKVNLLAKTTSVDGSKNIEKVALIAAKVYDYNNLKLSSISKMNNKELSLAIEEIERKSKTLYNYILNYITFVFGIEDLSYDALVEIENLKSIYSDQVNCIFRGKNVIISSNANDLLSLFQEICCSKKSAELNDIGNKMLDICIQEAPNLFRNAGAPCTFGKCEKENTCEKKKNAKIKQIIRTY